MKYTNKCAYCSRKADTKWRGEYFCDDCRKFLRRKKINCFMGKTRIVGYLLYKDIPVYLK